MARGKRAKAGDGGEANGSVTTIEQIKAAMVVDQFLKMGGAWERLPEKQIRDRGLERELFEGLDLEDADFWFEAARFARASGTTSTDPSPDALVWVKAHLKI